jgi:hypothetical protein
MSQLHHPQQPQPQQQQQQQDREGEIAAVNETSVAASGCSQQLQQRQCTQTNDKNTTASNKKKKKNNDNDNSNDKNKKEIPVPTITTVHRYNIDIPCTFNIPTSYIRHMPITYDEIYNTNNNNNKSNTNTTNKSTTGVIVEYNIDYDDEYWWINNIDFGPYAKARIINNHPTKTCADANDTTSSVSSNTAATATTATATTTANDNDETKQKRIDTTVDDHGVRTTTTAHVDDDNKTEVVQKKQLQHQTKEQAVGAVGAIPTMNTTTTTATNNNKSSKNKRNSRPGPKQRAALAAAAAAAAEAAAAIEEAAATAEAATAEVATAEVAATAETVTTDTTAMIIEESTSACESISNANTMMDIDEMVTTTTTATTTANFDISEINNSSNNNISSSSTNMPSLQSQPSLTLSSTTGAGINTNTTTYSSSSSSSATTTTHHDKLTIEDVILLNPKYLYSQYTTKQLLQYYNPKLPLVIFEQMLDILEKATGYETIITLSQAESILCNQIPCLLDIFGPLVLTKDDDIFSSSSSSSMLEKMVEDGRYLKMKKITNDKTEEENESSSSTSSSSSMSILSLPTLAQPITLSEMIQQVYTYWLNKRSRLRKPLLRRYWPVISSSDVNPHQVFRIRPEKEQNKRRLRKKRHNDVETYRKMKQLQLDMKYKLGSLCELITKREEVNKTIIELSNVYFEQRLRGWIGNVEQGILTSTTDATVATTTTMTLDKDMIERSLLNIPKYFDDRPIVRTRAGGGSSSNTGGGNKR